MNVIYKTNPRHTSSGVSLDAEIEIYFMIDMNSHTLRQENILLFNVIEQRVEPVEFSYNRRILKVKPISHLSPNSHYQLQLVGGEKGLKDITGRMMAQTYEVEFYTKDVKAIKPPIILSPTDTSIVRDAPTIRLESVPEASYYELEISKSNIFQNVVWPTNDEKVYNTSDIQVTPDILYTTGTYYMRVRSVDKEGIVSSWSPTIRYYYDGAPIIREPEEEPLPEEIETPVESGEPEGEVTTQQSSRRIVLKAMSQLQSEPSQLLKLQDAFSVKQSAALTGLYVKSTVPKDKSVHNNVAAFNDNRGNQRRIVIELTDDIDPDSVTSQTCYVLSERN